MMALDVLYTRDAWQKLQDAKQREQETAKKLQKVEEKARGLSWPKFLSLLHIVFGKCRNPPLISDHQGWPIYHGNRSLPSKTIVSLDQP